MKCPFCGSTNTQVKDSRDTIDETRHSQKARMPGLRRPFYNL